MASEGLVEGAIQIPPSGEAIVMLADHPTTGGYPVVGVVVPEDLAVVAQAVAGTRIQFRTLSASPPGGGRAPVR
jgi:allophanate hydrolase subunit 2